MMRAARFASQLGFEIAPDVLQAMKDMAGRISIISAERVRDEFTKILMSSSSASWDHATCRNWPCRSCSA
jgi:poly(A) polymerase